MNLKFSVAVSVYHKDNPQNFDRALKSITSDQTVGPTQVLLVVDGPVSAEIENVIEKYENQTGIFKTIRLSENKGLGNALRLAVNEADYELIARMDSDDIALPERFEKELALFENDPELDIAGGDIEEFIGDESNAIGKRVVPTTDDEIKEYMKTRCPFNHMTVMYKKEAALKAGNYQDLFWNEDYYLWIKMAEMGCRMANTGDVLAHVRSGQDMYKRRGGKKYFKSELYLQKYMRDKHIIGFGTYFMNVMKRVVIQILLPPTIRGWVFRKFARS